MLVSCLCPTFGRFPRYGHLLGEAVESFRRQELPPGVTAELVILNDCPQQVLTCPVPGVRVFNSAARLGSLGDKYNAMISLSRGDVMLPWEDDDVSLPGRVVQAVGRLSGGFDYFNPGRTFYFTQVDGRLHTAHSHGYCHNASAYTRRGFLLAKGYPSASGDQDAVMDARLRAVAATAPPLGDDPAEWTYVYCWGRSDLHLSGQPDPAAAWRLHGEKEFPAGRYEIVPGWRRDYAELAAEAAAEKAAPRG